MAVSIIIVDDHELIATGLAKHFEGNDAYQVLCTCSLPSEALKKIAVLQPDIVISDLDMPEMNGLEMIGIAKQTLPQTKFILLTMHLSKQIYNKAKQLKIDGYLPKNSDEEELLLCIEQLVKGKNYYSQKLIELLTDESQQEKSAGVLKCTQLLSEREREILILVAEGYSTKEIAEKVYLAPKTIETHRKNIMTKLEVHNLAGMVRIAVKEGLLDD